MTISAVVPAHNEAPRIGRVLGVLKSARCVQEIIVIDDGSTDDTRGAAEQYGIPVFRNGVRQGKGQALQRGVSVAKGDILFFCDADIDGLSTQMIEEIVAPVVSGYVEMSIGARRSKVRHLGHGHTYSPLLDGQRALTRGLWERVPERLKKGYRVEAALNYYAHSSAHLLCDISQITKEKKVGVVRGTYERYLMYADIALAHILNRLQV